MDESQIVIPLFVVRSSNPAKLNPYYVKEYNIEGDYLYQVCIVAFISENGYANCLFILTSDNQHKAPYEEMAYFRPDQRLEFSVYTSLPHRMLIDKNIDILEVGNEPMTEDNFLNLAARFISKKL